MIVIFDTETTGVDPLRDDVVQLAAVVLDEHGNTVQTFNRLCNPGREIPPEATAVHGIDDTDVMLAGSSRAVINAWWRTLLYTVKDPVLVGHNVLTFDIPLIRKHVEWEPFPVIDTYQAAIRLEIDPPSHRLADLHAGYRFESQKAHDALGDCLMVRDLLLTYLKHMGMTAGQFAAWLARPALLETMPFGKWKGKRFREIPVGYLKFMLTKDLSPDLRASMDHGLRYR